MISRHGKGGTVVPPLNFQEKTIYLPRTKVFAYKIHPTMNNRATTIHFEYILPCRFSSFTIC